MQGIFVVVVVVVVVGGDMGQKLFCVHQRHKPVKGGGGGTTNALFSLCCYAISCILSRFLLYFAHMKSSLDLF